ncbi:MAG: glycosyltransferase [Candidatus Aenigmarchaeota archaeon]|nr:glycosyltransferase [Candidatus Aenigmarchaeota archaeon]
MSLTLLHPYSVFIYEMITYPVIFFSAIFYFIAIRDLVQRKKITVSEEVDVKSKKLPFVTIQIPTLNEIVAVRCAKRCLELDYPKDKYEIIIGDDSNDKKISRRIDKFIHKYSQVKVSRRGNNKGFKAGNLNYMLKQSKGEIIVIFDSDFVPHKDFLKKIVKPFEDTNVACVQTKWGYINKNQNRVSKLATSVLMVYHHILAPINERLGISLLFGSGEAVRRSALEELGGWQEGSLTEDVEFSVRVLKKGYKIKYLHSFETPGEVPFTVKGFAKQQRRWAYGNTKAFIDHSKDILFGKIFTIKQKLYLMFTLLGYLISPFIAIFFISGTLTWFTGTPGPIDWGKFLFVFGKMLLLTSGYLFSVYVALRREGGGRYIFNVFFSSLTIGIFVTFYVCLGVLKAFIGKGMAWTIIPKQGNRGVKI